MRPLMTNARGRQPADAEKVPASPLRAADELGTRKHWVRYPHHLEQSRVCWGGLFAGVGGRYLTQLLDGRGLKGRGLRQQSPSKRCQC